MARPRVNARQARCPPLSNARSCGKDAHGNRTICIFRTRRTGLESHDEFLVAVERYRQQEFIPKEFDSLSRQKPWLNAAVPEERLQLHALHAPSPTLFGRLAAAAWPLSILIIEMIILMMWGAISFERYDVRV